MLQLTGKCVLCILSYTPKKCAHFLLVGVTPNHDIEVVESRNHQIEEIWWSQPPDRTTWSFSKVMQPSLKVMLGWWMTNHERDEQIYFGLLAFFYLNLMISTNVQWSIRGAIETSTGDKGQCSYKTRWHWWHDEWTDHKRWYNGDKIQTILFGKLPRGLLSKCLGDEIHLDNQKNWFAKLLLFF